MADRETLEGLWAVALEDAGFGVGDVDLVLVDTKDAEFVETSYEPRGQPGPSLPDDAPQVANRIDRPRVFVIQEPRELQRESTSLALMRYSLEYHRFYSESLSVYALNLYTSWALQEVFVGKGMGASVMWNAIPMMRSANAAAARLVTERYGPQTGQLNHPAYGQLFRLTHEPLERAERSRISTVFAACWPEEMQKFAEGTRLVLADSAEDLVEDVDQQAITWWRALQADPTFVSVRESARLFMPTQEEIEALPLPADAWRPLEGLIDRAVRYGLTVVAR